MQTILETARQAAGPIVDGDQVTFVWQGAAPVQVLSDRNYWGQDRPLLPMDPIAPDVWTATVTLARDAYIEYAFVQGEERFPDPLNPRQVDNGFGHTNSALWMPDAVDTPLALVQPDVATGRLTTHQVPGRGYVMDDHRTVHLYQPLVREPTPLLVVLDGTGYLRQACIATIVDNLLAQDRIRPVSLALVDPGPRGRSVEYACSDATVAFIIRCVLPLAQAELNLVDTGQSPGGFGMMGASMGGLMSLYTALRAPEIFGRVLCESGAFGADHLYYRSVIYDLIRLGPAPPVKVWMDCGEMEWYLAPNREMNQLLRERGYDVTYVEHTSGHNYPSWRNSLWRGLEYLYGV
jgi:enterochelin esterase-like enzyme